MTGLQRLTHAWLVLGAAAVIWLLAALPGCKPAWESSGEFIDSGQAVQQSRGHFSLAMEFLHQLDQYEQKQAQRQILYHMNRWIDRQEEAPDWVADPLHAQLPSRFRNVSGSDFIPRLHFHESDFFYLRETVWMHDIAKSVVSRQTDRLREIKDAYQEAAPPDEKVGRELRSLGWFAEVEQSHGEEAAHSLAIAQWLFDWTVRNIQLDAYPRATSQSVAPAGPEQSSSKKQPGKASTAKAKKPTVAGPGTKYLAWQSLLLGHGDALQRARIFILLARQQGIDVVMLAVGQQEEDSQPSPARLAAVLLKGQLYLFDMSLGLPIPGPKGQAIATLQQLRADPSLLRVLDLEEQHRYPLEQADLANVVALIDATPASLSQRMWLVEARLSGEQKMVLTCQPKALDHRLRKCKGIADARLWTLLYEAYQYHGQLSRDRQALVQLNREFRFFAGLTPLFRGRLLHLRGEFDSSETKLGAKGYYLQCRPSDEEIASISAQHLQAFKKWTSDPAQNARNIKSIQESLTETKQHASYWLGLVAYETGEPNRYSVAIDFFNQRTLKASPDGPWTHGARYNLARAYEAIGQTGKARELYLADDSPQRHGNRLRARRLKAESPEKQTVESTEK